MLGENAAAAAAEAAVALFVLNKPLPWSFLPPPVPEAALVQGLPMEVKPLAGGLFLPAAVGVVLVPALVPSVVLVVLEEVL